MRLKPVPAPPVDATDGPGTDLLAFLETARLAVPLVPGSEDDCCARLMARVDEVASRDQARTWLTFLRALGLARETASGGFVRTDAPVNRGALADAFRERVFGARELLSILAAAADEPVSAAEAFEAFEPTVPNWERHKDPGRWREVWRERVERLLDWAVLLGVAARRDGGYVAVER